MIKKIFFVISIIFFLFSIKKNNFKKENIKSFQKYKLVAIKIHKNAPGSFYCGCKIIWHGKKGIPDLSSCGYKIRKNKNRATRIEWEHVVPSWQFGHEKQCWKKGGRKKCLKNKLYQKIEFDLHNLQPVIGEINSDRSNFIYSELNNNFQEYGKCTMKIDFKKKLAEPPERSKGAIARTYFYMLKRYNIKLSMNEKLLFKKWDIKFPVTKWECIRENLIFHKQGNHNNYVYKKCLNLRLPYKNLKN
ncbi:deoxyribonuclease I [Buchnera aphidicola (Melanaphis sacchari)]|uniref:Deoxyribonuclease I n=1 Tax=Buchnera aphidicola (Melanaphis sacchari) TaxID=2173854 RepID=A0A2U8DEY7_9GAMM|nr:endonuclease [Buchnera aphidicola]AWH90389.1 deoxyribonuclease I [Buchnera aphidicola (Melanaphis sacchari)]